MNWITKLMFSLAIVEAIGNVAIGQEGPLKEIPELAVLANYAGTWDIRIEVPNSANVEKGEVIAEWILGGRFLEQRGKLEFKDGQQSEIRTLYTYDTGKKQYRSWTFVSNGSVSEAKMTWNPDTKTMTSTWVPDSSGSETVVTADFSEKGKERWKFTFKNAEGVNVGQMKGENTLRSTRKDQ